MASKYQGVLAPFPQSNMAPSQQDWRLSVEKRLYEMEAVANRAANGVAKQTAAWGPLLSSVEALSSQVEDARMLGDSAREVAGDMNVWSEERPVSPADDGSVANPDRPANPNAMWYVYEGDKDNIKEIWTWVEPTLLDGDVEGEWVQRKFGTDTLGEGAVDLKNLASSLSSDITTATNAVAGLDARFSALSDQARAARERADRAYEAAQNAGPGGSADGRTIVSDSEPAGADRKVGNLWINTQGGKADPYFYDADTDTWKRIKDEEAVAAARAAADAKREAEQALAKAQDVQDMATAASLAATRAQASADGKNKIFYTPEKPTLNGRVQGDLWFDTDDSYKAYVYTEAAKDFAPLELTADSGPVDVADIVASGRPASDATAKALWDKALSSGAAAGNPITASHMAKNSITATSGIIQSLDAGVITAGVVNPDRIGARSITAAKLAAGTITANSGVIGSLDASKITVGQMSGAHIIAGTIRSNHLSADAIDGRVITGATLRTAATGARTQIDNSGMVIVDANNVIVADMKHPTGIRVKNQNTNTLVNLTDRLFGGVAWSNSSRMDMVAKVKGQNSAVGDFKTWYTPWKAPTNRAVFTLGCDLETNFGAVPDVANASVFVQLVVRFRPVQGSGKTITKPSLKHRFNRGEIITEGMGGTFTSVISGLTPGTSYAIEVRGFTSTTLSTLGGYSFYVYNRDIVVQPI